jgi:hypothetical protein
VAEEQMQRRREALEKRSAMNAKADLALGSPCLFCLHSFAKVPWQDGRANISRALPVMQVV